MSNVWESRPTVLEECDRLSSYAEYMRDFAEKNLEERQRRQRNNRIWDWSCVLLVLGVVLLVWWKN